MPKGSFFSILPVIRDMPGERREGRAIGKSRGTGGDGKLNNSGSGKNSANLSGLSTVSSLLPIRVHPRDPWQTLSGSKIAHE
jgi:hypothetical protein